MEDWGRQLGYSFAARDHDVGGIVKGRHWRRYPGGDANGVVLLRSLLTIVLLVLLLLHQGQGGVLIGAGLGILVCAGLVGA